MSNIWSCGRASDGQLGIVGNGSVLELNHLNIKGMDPNLTSFQEQMKHKVKYLS